jgi:hypothetical protein
LTVETTFKRASEEEIAAILIAEFGVVHKDRPGPVYLSMPTALRIARSIQRVLSLPVQVRR